MADGGAISMLCIDSRSSETSNQSHLSELAHKKKLSLSRQRRSSSARSLKATEMPSCTFHSKARVIQRKFPTLRGVFALCHHLLASWGGMNKNRSATRVKYVAFIRRFFFFFGGGDTISDTLIQAVISSRFETYVQLRLKAPFNYKHNDRWLTNPRKK